LTTMLPNSEQIESELAILKQERSSTHGQLSKVQGEIENLTDSIASTGDKRIRNLLESNLSSKLDEEERLEKSNEEISTKIEELGKIQGNLQQRIKDMRELIAFMEKSDPDKLVDIRLRLREVLRNTIDEIRLFPEGYKDKEHVEQEVTSKAKRTVYYDGINNKEWRFYTVQFKRCRSFTRGFYPDGVFKKLEEIDRKRRGKGFSLN